MVSEGEAIHAANKAIDYFTPSKNTQEPKCVSIILENHSTFTTATEEESDFVLNDGQCAVRGKNLACSPARRHLKSKVLESAFRQNLSSGTDSFVKAAPR